MTMHEEEIQQALKSMPLGLQARLEAAAAVSPDPGLGMSLKSGEWLKLGVALFYYGDPTLRQDFVEWHTQRFGS